MKKTLSSAYISGFCYELSLILKAGIPLTEGVSLVAENERDKRVKAALTGVCEQLELGERFYTAASAAGIFPKYMLDMLDIGEKTGKLEAVMLALSGYYDRRESISKTVRNAVIYPAILLVMMLFVIVVLVTKVMPIFADVFAQLGGSMSPAAVWILRFGEGLGRNWAIPAAVLAGLVAVCLVLSRIPAVRTAVREKLASLTFSFHLGKTVASAQFASAMAMTMAGGLDMEESLEMAERVTANAKMRAEIQKCRALCGRGEGFGDAVTKSGVLSPLNAQMLAVGIRAGSGDTVMEEIARRSEQEVAEETETALSRVEPAIVILMTVLVAAILISVMIPLMSIMSTI